MNKLWNKNYILLLQGSLISCFGDVLYSICISYWVYEETGSTALMAVMSSISMFTSMFLSPLAGTFVDKFNRRNILVITDAIRGVIMILLGIICFQGNMTVSMVLIVAFIASLCNVIFSPASSTIFADVVPADELVRGQSIHSGGNSLIQFSGKALSGLCIVTFGVPFLILANGISFLLSAFTELFIQVKPNVKEGTPVSINSIISDLKDGFHSAFTTKGLRKLLLASLVINLFGAGYFSLFLPICYAKNMDIVQYGTVCSIMAIGQFLGIVICSIIKFKKEYKSKIIGVSFLLTGVFLILFFYTNNYYLSLLFLTISELLNSIANALLSSSIILLIEEDKRGTVIGFLMTFSIGGSALSTLAYGFLSEVFPIITLSVIGTFLMMIPIIPLIIDREVKESLSTVG